MSKDLPGVTVKGFSNVYRKQFEKLRNTAKTLFRNANAWIFDTGAQDRFFYGADDRLPNAIIEAINNSGTATSCVEKLIEFTFAEGFVDPNIAGARLNDNKTFNQKLLDICMNYSYLQGIGIHILPTNEGKIFKWDPVAVQMLRREQNGFLFNELMGEFGRQEHEDLFLHEWFPGTPLEVRMAQMAEQRKRYKKVTGFIYYPFVKRMGRLYNKYPVPDFYSDIESIIADGKVSEFDLRNITQGWRAPIVISTGPMNNEIKDANDKTELDRFGDSIAEFVGEDAAPVMHLMGRTDGEKPTVTVLPLEDIVDAAAGASERVPRRVCRVMCVPPILVGFSEAGKLGDTQELQNTMKLFALSVIKRQEFISEALEALRPDLPPEFAQANFEITTLDVFGTDAADVISNRANLTGRQNRAIESLMRKVKNGTMPQATAVLKLADYGYDEERAVQLIESYAQSNNN